MTSQTIAAAGEYWDRYYVGEFFFGLGTEDILKMLLQVPPVGTWLDLGAGSESPLQVLGGIFARKGERSLYHQTHSLNFLWNAFEAHARDH